jgi:hypothetical protein
LYVKCPVRVSPSVEVPVIFTDDAVGGPLLRISDVGLLTAELPVPLKETGVT